MHTKHEPMSVYYTDMGVRGQSIPFMRSHAETGITVYGSKRPATASRVYKRVESHERKLVLELTA